MQRKNCVNHIDVKQNGDAQLTSDDTQASMNPQFQSAQKETIEDLDQNDSTQNSDMVENTVSQIVFQVIEKLRRKNEVSQKNLELKISNISNKAQPQTQLTKKNTELLLEIQKLQFQLINSSVQRDLYKTELQCERERLNNITAQYKLNIEKIQKNSQTQKQYVQDKLKACKEKVQGKKGEIEKLQDEKQSIKNEFEKTKKETAQKILQILKEISKDGQIIKFSQQIEKLIQGLNEIEQKLKKIKKEDEEQNKFLKQDINKLVSCVNLVNKENFYYPKYKKDNYFFSNKIIPSLNKNLLDEVILPNSECLIEFLTTIDSTVKEILQRWKDQVDGDKEAIRELKVKMKKLQGQKQRLENTVKEIQIREKQAIKQRENSIAQLKKNNQSFKQTNATLNQEIKTLKSQLQDLKDWSRINTTKLNDQAKERQEQFNNKIQELKQTITKLTGQNDQRKNIITVLQAKFTSLQGDNTRLIKQLENAQQKFINYEKTARQQQQTLTNLQSNCKGLQMKTKNGTAVQKKYQEDISSLKKQLSLAQNDLQILKQKHKQSEIIVKQQKYKIAILSQKPKQIRCFLQYFNGTVLNYKNPSDVQWFVQSIQAGCGRRIKSTLLLYRYDLHNKTSFHHYIDNKPHLVIVIKVQNGNTIAGYSQPALQRNVDYDYKPGMMFSFDNQRVFHTKTQTTNTLNKTKPRPLIYDEYFIIWGNSDIRIRSGSDELYSAYGTNNSSFEERGIKNMSVLDMGFPAHRDIKLVDYEVFQVVFDE